MNVRIVAAAVGSLLALTACAGANSPAGLAPGTCLADYNGSDSNRESIVDCSIDHTFDVYATATWPGMDAAIAAADPAVVFDAIHAEEASDTSDAYWTWAYEECSARFLDYIGLADVTIGGQSSQDLRLLPAGRWDYDYSLTTRDEFVSGDHSTLCSITWFDQTGTTITVAHDAGETLSTLLSNFTPELQGCFTRDTQADVKYSDTNCTEPHNGQYLMYFDMVPALGADFVRSMDPETTIFPDYEPLDAFCTSVIDTVYPGVLDSPSWIVWSDQTGRNQGWKDFDGTIDPDQLYPGYCAILAKTATLRGDVISGNVTVSLQIG